MNTRTQNGFTLIEACVYLALLSFLLVGGLLATYQILAGQGQAKSRGATQDEGGFVVRKIGWALGDLTSITTPASGTSDTLDIMTGYGRIQVCRDGTVIFIRERGTGGSCGDASYTALTTANVSATALTFHYIAPSGSGPEGIEASATVDGVQFGTLRYTR